MKNEKIIEVLKRMIIFCYAFTPADSNSYADKKNIPWRIFIFRRDYFRD